MDDELDLNPLRTSVGGALEVTGVSRSGRVRKKSSKLTGFESLDSEIKPKTKKEKLLEVSQTFPSISKEEEINDGETSDEDFRNTGRRSINTDYIISDDSVTDIFPDNSSLESIGFPDVNELEMGSFDHVEQNIGFQPIGDITDDDSQTYSQPILDKPTKKKLVIKDGKIISEIKNMQKNKGIYKRGSKRGSTKNMVQIAGPSSESPKKTKHRKTKMSISVASTSSSENRLVVSNTRGSTTASSSECFKPVGTTPLDVAAHLRLLGESLTIIGERLTEHEGQIAVSGSVSVLLDSLLCALGPLMCLTQQVPEMNVIPQEQLSHLMDNIAYIMPGL